jgi:hypothetical protein
LLHRGQGEALLSVGCNPRKKSLLLHLQNPLETER